MFFTPLKSLARTTLKPGLKVTHSAKQQLQSKPWASSYLDEFNQDMGNALEHIGARAKVGWNDDSKRLYISITEQNGQKAHVNISRNVPLDGFKARLEAAMAKVGCSRKPTVTSHTQSATQPASAHSVQPKKTATGQSCVDRIYQESTGGANSGMRSEVSSIYSTHTEQREGGVVTGAVSPVSASAHFPRASLVSLPKALQNTPSGEAIVQYINKEIGIEPHRSLKVPSGELSPSQDCAPSILSLELPKISLLSSMQSESPAKMVTSRAMESAKPVNTPLTRGQKLGHQIHGDWVPSQNLTRGERLGLKIHGKYQPSLFSEVQERRTPFARLEIGQSSKGPCQEKAVQNQFENVPQPEAQSPLFKKDASHPVPDLNLKSAPGREEAIQKQREHTKPGPQAQRLRSKGETIQSLFDYMPGLDALNPINQLISDNAKLIKGHARSDSDRLMDEFPGGKVEESVPILREHNSVHQLELQCSESIKASRAVIENARPHISFRKKLANL